MSQPPLPSPDPAISRSTGDVDAALQVRFGDMINQAKQAGETDTNAVQEARQLLNSGQLTSPENIRDAAKNILSYGI